MGQSKRRIGFGLFIALIALVVAACGNAPDSQGGSGKAGATATANYTHTVTVEIENFKFEPAEITVAPGTRVVFVNKDPTPHNVVEGTAQQVADAGHKALFTSPDLDTNETWEYVFDTEGEYPYACTIAGHYLLGMVGTVHVVEGAEQTVQASSGLVEDPDHMHAAVVPSVALENPDQYIVKPEGLVELQPVKVDGNIKEFDMDIQEVTHEILDGVPVTAWAFNGVVPGPVLRVTEGDVVRVHFTNTHHQPHTIHWHGIYADQEHDGVPHTSAAVMPGESRTYEFVAADAGTFWYHCHVDSYRHVDMGMYGALIVDPKDPSEVTWDREYTLVLDDWDSEIEPLAQYYRPDHNHFVVNGKAFPEIPSITLPVGEVTRVRFINAGYNNFAMHLHGPRFLVVDTDGRPLPMPYEKDTLDIAPGERYDIEILPTKAGDYPFHAHNLQFNLNDGIYPGGMHLMVHIVDSVEAE